MNAVRKLHDSAPFAVAELARQIREAVGEDDQAFLDTLDGETDAIDAARAVVRWIAECEANAQAMGDLADAYKARAKVHADRIPAAKEALLRFLTTIEETTLRLPEATLSVKQGVRQLVGEAEDLAGIDLRFQRIKTIREPDKAKIKEHLEAGGAVAGFSLSNGPPTLQVRRS